MSYILIKHVNKITRKSPICEERNLGPLPPPLKTLPCAASCPQSAIMRQILRCTPPPPPTPT